MIRKHGQDGELKLALNSMVKEDLKKIAAARRVPYQTMVRAWILERLAQEKNI